jgi:hypothetical protein
VDYYEFVCAGAPSMSVAAARRDAANLPGAALVCCRKWKFSRSFTLGDGSHAPALDAAIKRRVAAEGYYLFDNRSAN